jgi:hypothetical protein
MTSGTEPLTLYRCVLHGAVFGLLVTEDGRVFRAAPIARWAEGKPLAKFLAWAVKRGGSVEVVKVTAGGMK